MMVWFYLNDCCYDEYSHHHSLIPQQPVIRLQQLGIKPPLDNDIEAMKMHFLEFDELITYFVLMIAAFEEVVAMDDVEQENLLLDVVTVYSYLLSTEMICFGIGIYSFLLVLTIKGFVH